MKKFLLAVMAVFAMNLTAHAHDQTPAQDELMPADQLATMDGLDQNAPDAMDDLMPPPPPHPHPHPYPPHPHPHPVPPPPPYHPPHPHPYPPHPHPYPPYPHPYPPAYWYECSAQDQYGQVYTDRGSNPVATQRDVHYRCESHSGTYCSDLGCRRY